MISRENGGGFTESEEALQTNSTAGLSVQFYNSKEPTAYMQLYCHIVTPTALQHDLLLGRDSFLKFQNHTYATLPNETGKPSVGILDLRKNPKAVAWIQAEDKENDFHLRYVGKEMASLIPHPYMLKVTLVRSDNTPAMTGSYFVQFLEEWNLDEDVMIVKEGRQNIPLTSHEYTQISPGALLGISNGPMRSITLENTRLQESIRRTDVATIRKSSQLDEGRGEESDRREEPPVTLGVHLPAPQRESLKRSMAEASQTHERNKVQTCRARVEP